MVNCSLTLANLVGLQMKWSGFALDMRGFGFGDPDTGTEVQPGDLVLHIQCPWRIESATEIVVGRGDWFEAEMAESDPSPGPDWNPASDSLQQAKLRSLFEDIDSAGVLQNRTALLLVEAAATSQYGDLDLELSGGYRLRAFPAGSRGEFWRLFIKGEPDSDYVSERE